MTLRPHDALFKETFSDLANARGELAAVLPPEVAAIVDWATLRLEPGSFVDENLAERMTDLLFSARIRGNEARLYLLFEHQSSPDPLMPFRALAYVVRVWEAWLAATPGARRLPPVVPIVLSQVEGGWTSATELAHVIDFADDEERRLLEPLVPRCRILVDDLARTSDDVLDARSMPVAAKLALAALRDIRSTPSVVSALTDWARWVQVLAREPSGGAALRTLMRYILHARPGIDVEDLAGAVRAIEPNAEETIMTTARQLIEQGEARGEARGRAAMLLNLLALRFQTIPPHLRARIEASDAATLDRWAARVLTAPTLEDVLDD